MGLEPNSNQIGGKACYITKNRSFYLEKIYFQQARKCNLYHLNMYFTDQIAMQRGDQWN